MTDHKVVSRAEWQAARDGLLRREKEHARATGCRRAATRARDSRPGSAATTSTP